jgi:uncharacterized protein YndB with AHSA1/START domain
VVADPHRDSIHIKAEPELVFDYFTLPEALTRWMGDRAVLDPRPGGEFTLYVGDKCIEGRYVEFDRPRRIVITWGRRGSPSFPSSSSTLEVELTPEADGTRVDIVHHGLPENEAAQHALGWRLYLARLRGLGSGIAVKAPVGPGRLRVKSPLKGGIQREFRHRRCEKSRGKGQDRPRGGRVCVPLPVAPSRAVSSLSARASG